MKILSSFLILISTALSFAAPERLNSFKGFVKISAERELFVDWTYAKANKPTVILINGLTYSTKQWDRFTEVLVEKGIGVLRYDPQGMGETLLKYAPILENITYESQVDDLKALLKTLKINQKVNLVGLSYGGGIGIAFAAKYPDSVKSMIAMAPYTAPVATQDEWVRSQVWLTRKTVPWNTATDEALYEFYFRQLVYLTYPGVEPVVLENPYKLEATFRMANGIRPLIAKSVVGKLPAGSFHLIIAGSDQYIQREVLEDFWKSVPENIRASKTIMNNVEHKIPEAAPQFSALYVEKILSESILSGGKEFDADPVSGRVKYDGGSFELPKGR